MIEVILRRTPMRPSPRFQNRIILSLLTAVLLFSGCVSAAKMLDRAEDAWTRGQYAEAINQALSSYEKAVEKNKEPGEIDAARAFLEEKMPQANDNLLTRAEQQLDGSDSEKANAWKTFQTLVNLNLRVRNSIASSFLSTEDYTEQLKRAKDVAAQIKYVKALELMGMDKRSAYIEASGILKEIDSFVPDYRDIHALLELCYEAGTLVVAISDRDIDFSARKGNVADNSNYGVDVYSEVRKFVETNDNPDFLDFVTAGSVTSAQDAGAVLFVEVQGEVWTSAETSDSYLKDGSITWERSYGGTPTLVVTRLSDARNEVAPVSLDMEQSVSIEFFPAKYETTSLTQDMYSKQFNNLVWMSSQLSKAEAVLSSVDGDEDMIVWAEMQYGGVAKFLNSAQVNGAEGTQDLPIAGEIYGATQKFINETLPKFLLFEDIDLHSRIVAEMSQGFFSDSGIRELLSDLED